MIWLTRPKEKNSKTLVALRNLGFIPIDMDGTPYTNGRVVDGDWYAGGSSGGHDDGLTPCRVDGWSAHDMRQRFQVIDLPVIEVKELLCRLPPWMIDYYDRFVISSLTGAKVWVNSIAFCHQKFQRQKKFLYIIGRSVANFIVNQLQYRNDVDYLLLQSSMAIYPTIRSFLDDTIDTRLSNGNRGFECVAMMSRCDYIRYSNMLYISGRDIANEDIGAILQDRGIALHRIIVYSIRRCEIMRGDYRLLAMSRSLKMGETLIIMSYSYQVGIYIMDIVQSQNIDTSKIIVICISGRVAHYFQQCKRNFLDVKIAAKPDEEGMLEALSESLKKNLNFNC